MKLRYLLTAFVATLAFAVGCVDQLPGDLASLQVSSSYISIPPAGGSQTITVKATEAWAFNSVPDWLKVTPTAGGAGEIAVTFSAGESLDTRAAELSIKVGANEQFINVTQQVGSGELTPSTCAEIIAGPVGKTYQAEGVCTSIANTTYGNWYLQDDTGSIYIYGTVDKTGSYNWKSFGIEVGDRVLVEGPKVVYNNIVELVDVKVLKVTKSLIKVESDPIEIGKAGEAFEVELTCKGDGLSISIPDNAKSWLTVEAIILNGTKAVVKFNAAPNTGGARKTTLVFTTTSKGQVNTAETTVTQEGSILEMSIKDFLAQPESETALYRLTGKVSKLAASAYGNFDLVDATGKVYVYGLTATQVAKNDKSFPSLGIQEGDMVTLIGTRTSYNKVAQVGGPACHVSHTIHTDVASIADFLSKEVASKVFESPYYKITGTITEILNETYGNFYLQDASGTVYVYGLTVCGVAKNDKSFSSLGLKVGDVVTMMGQRGQYANAKVPEQKEQVSNGYYISHTAGSGGGDVSSGVLTLTVEGLPAAYSGDVTEVTLSGQKFKIVNVANYGSGIQISGAKSRDAGYITNVVGTKKIKTIKVTCASGKTWYPNNLVLYAGAAANPGETVIAATSDETSSTYDLSGGDYKFFTLKNPSDYTVYLDKIEITYAE
ncbi:MAG TPA: BACON domain-containing carbohydrate-binding protein [Bacteroidales bacterium]|jgi:signal peptidase I|nr:BACON domain-containing carbohydrate-binding protein [Bacteroidales bacterium]HPB89164.1 BACON domain-containing carbohydrate-binding protein [Bacteroidales bacterium]HPY21528.1 BACON domain-containing carbohydrate-binding protein [Bacteroidales bacterium]HQN24030.1 BACON domain-containing carbohydrate-binding protein [Bacteroidales bacterium]HQP78369.1 BACON domain-containing carbohydrate-binding protein [Bacteroidales bacterium]